MFCSIIANNPFCFLTGFFGMWTFGRSSKQPGPQSKKVLEIPNLRTLELTGDLIGHSGAVQVRTRDILDMTDVL